MHPLKQRPFFFFFLNGGRGRGARGRKTKFLPGAGEGVRAGGGLRRGSKPPKAQNPKGGGRVKRQKKCLKNWVSGRQKKKKQKPQHLGGAGRTPAAAWVTPAACLWVLPSGIAPKKQRRSHEKMLPPRALLPSPQKLPGTFYGGKNGGGGDSDEQSVWGGAKSWGRKPAGPPISGLVFRGGTEFLGNGGEHLGSVPGGERLYWGWGTKKGGRLGSRTYLLFSGQQPKTKIFSLDGGERPWGGGEGARGGRTGFTFTGGDKKKKKKKKVGVFSPGKKKKGKGNPALVTGGGGGDLILSSTGGRLLSPPRPNWDFCNKKKLFFFKRGGD